MNKKLLIAAVLLVSVLLVGCDSKSNYNGYAASNPSQQGQPNSGQYVGGGCGVAPSGAYEDTPINALNSVNSVL